MRIKRFNQFMNEELRISTEKHKCPVCGGQLYRTDAGGTSATLQCSSPEARFWDFPRGSQEQKKAHDHFMRSTVYVSNQEWDELTSKKGDMAGNVMETIPASKARPDKLS